jgi:mRNA interferase MazF
VQCEDIRVVSKVRLGDLIQEIDNDDMKEIKKRIKRALQV